MNSRDGATDTGTPTGSTAAPATYERDHDTVNSPTEPTTDDTMGTGDLDGTEGAELLDQVRAALVRYVVLPTPQALDAVTLWVAATHAQPFWAHAARLVIRAPEKRCGKSRLLDLVEALSWHPLITVNASPAAIYRSIGTSEPPTILLDEADTVFGPKAGDNNEELRGLLNAGHQRNRPALRYDANTQSVVTIDTFAMAALAGIGQMPDTIEDRAVVIRMRRRGPGEHVWPFRHRRDAPALSQLRGQLHHWIRTHGKALEAATPPMPLEDRAADTWESLVAVADLAGGDWPARARAAALALTADHDASTDTPLSVRLLEDCRSAFRSAQQLPSEELLSRLKEDPEAPWSTWGGRADGLTAMKLGRFLKEFDIRSLNIRFDPDQWPGVGQVKGYDRVAFEDAWSRYCPAETPNEVTDRDDEGGAAAGRGRDCGSGPAGKPSQPSQPSQPSHRRSGLGRLETWDGSSRPTTGLWDGSSRPTPQAVPGLTSTGTAGTAGTAYPPTPATCIACREPLSFDDGSHAHPLCRPA